MATSLSKSQCDTIMAPILDAGLASLGINHRMTRAVVYGPKQYQGVRIPDLRTLQGILKLGLAVAHGDAPTITGCSLRAVLALHTIELGLPGHIFQQDYSKFSHLATHSWVKHLWDFCDTTSISLVPSSPTLKLARENDEFIMLQFSKFGYHTQELAQLNLCRLWCHAVRLSDLTTGDGKRIHPLTWNGYHPDDAGSDFQWPMHGRPTPKCWVLWQTALRACFLTLQMPQQCLRRPLGRWRTPIPPTWIWMFSHQRPSLSAHRHEL